MRRRWKGRRASVPNLRRLRETAEVYCEQHRIALEEHDFEGRVMATCGLIARGVESVPYWSRMLRSNAPEAREDAAGAFGWMALNDPSIGGELIEALETETDPQVVDSLIIALGRLRDRRAIDPLAHLLLAPGTDSDTRHTALQSLARIAGQRFDRAADPLEAAAEWLAAQGHTTPDESE